MATSNQYAGRREGFGIGIETVPGTSVAPLTGSFLRWLDQDLFTKVDFIENESAIGIIDRVSDSEPVAVYAEGKLGGKVTATNVGYLLTGFNGFPSTSGTGTFTHVFTMNQSSVPTPALTFARANPLQSKRHAYGVIDSLEFSAEAGGWVTVEAGLKARVGVNSTETISVPATETEFTSKHITITWGGTALKASSLKLKLSRPSNAFNPLGTSDLPEFDRGEFDTPTGEFTVRYTDTQYEDDYIANTVKSLSIAMTNGAQSLTFAATRARTRELSRSTDKDGVITLTVAFACEVDTAVSRSIQTTLVNTKSGYTS